MLKLRQEAACCIVLLLSLSVMLLPVCGPMLCAHPCCPDHAPHCTVSADLASACPATMQITAPAVQAQSQSMDAFPVLTVSAWSEARVRVIGALASAKGEPPSVPSPLRI